MNPFVLYVEPLALLGIVGYGLRFPTHPRLRYYFIAQGIYTVCIWSGVWFLDLNGDWYASVYVFATAINVLAALWITLSSIIEYHSPIILLDMGALTAICVLWASAVNEPRPIIIADWACILEGAAKMGLGAMLGLIAPFLYGKREFSIGLTFALLWLAEGVFRLEYRLNWHNAAWTTANLYAPWFATTAALLFVAWKAHEAALLETRSTTSPQAPCPKAR